MSKKRKQYSSEFMVKVALMM